MTKKIIMDCDPGHDDAIALILAGAKQSPLYRPSGRARAAG